MKPAKWIGSSLEDLRELSDEVRTEFGFAIFEAQCGGKHIHAKPMKGLGGGILEVVENHEGDTFRAVYTVRYEEAVYVLHVFQKKSRKGIETPRHDVELIRRRLEIARQSHEAFVEKGGGRAGG